MREEGNGRDDEMGDDEMGGSDKMGGWEGRIVCDCVTTVVM